MLLEHKIQGAGQPDMVSGKAGWDRILESSLVMPGNLGFTLQVRREPLKILIRSKINSSVRSGV